MKVYSSIPSDIKPHVGAAKLHYADAFDIDFSFLLRERKYADLFAMFKDDLEVEDKLMAYGKMKQRVEVDRRRTREDNQASTYTSNDAKFDIRMKRMERFMDILELENRPPNKEQPEPLL